ncbi:hypothetical protein, conserved [Trypanosoma brucei gambiense DAL972]|uniref:RRM domain-containing protein n=1 Tax=Trypanosoma brucei gambiense (strain MHOM/CI/86/DAL972) TaxID=679716 RepID=C9ZK90_TRYB9|nr:hypothetical protein, conserved [Trypanosoma brucei gambiense DAL972]CBH09854.1 hypothetical protein, conserved [Trypanosoma brucei gambiense DAL972]|eukprot:XP_011772147.1 hypothetical protein, conserved [Trypanosoma brucei gambiense DAL972]
MDEKPRLIEHTSACRGTADVLILSGFPWYVTEGQVRKYLTEIHPSNIAPLTVRLYTNPANGSSRGICFVEYCPKQSNTGGASQGIKNEFPERKQKGEAEDIAALMKLRIEATAYERHYIRVLLYRLTNRNWDRGGRLPDLPTDPPPLATSRGGVLEGYGDEGFTVRCSALLGLANTVTPNGIASMQTLRKRFREEAAEAAMPNKSDEGYPGSSAARQ